MCRYFFDNQGTVQYITLKLISYVTSMDCLCLQLDLNIPECHIRDSSLSLYIFDSTGVQYHDIKLSLYRYRYVSQIPTHVCAIFVRMCACACARARVCVYAHVSSSAL